MPDLNGTSYIRRRAPRRSFSKIRTFVDLPNLIEVQRRSYERFLQMQRFAEPIMGSPEQCAKAIAGIMAARLPRSRYLIGLDAQAINLTSRLTPTAVQDRFMRLVLGL